MEAQTIYLRPWEVARLMRTSTSTLAKMRSRGDGPPFVKSGRKSVLYDRAAVLQWLSARTVKSTREAHSLL